MKSEFQRFMHTNEGVLLTVTHRTGSVGNCRNNLGSYDICFGNWQHAYTYDTTGGRLPAGYRSMGTNEDDGWLRENLVFHAVLQRDWYDEYIRAIACGDYFSMSWSILGTGAVDKPCLTWPCSSEFLDNPKYYVYTLIWLSHFWNNWYHLNISQ